MSPRDTPVLFFLLFFFVRYDMYPGAEARLSTLLFSLLFSLHTEPACTDFSDCVLGLEHLLLTHVTQ